MKKIASQAILSLLRKDITKMDNTGSLSHTYALNPIAFLSGSDVDCMLAETPSPICPYIALQSHLATQSYVLKHYQEIQTRTLLGLIVSKALNDNQLPDVFYAHEWYTDLRHQDNASYQVVHAMDSLLQEIPPLSVRLWVRNHCQHQDNGASRLHQRTQDVPVWEEYSYLHLWHHDYSMSLTWPFFNSSTRSRLSIYSGSGDVTLSLPRFHLMPRRLISILMDD